MHRLRKIKTLRELGQFYWRTFSPEEMNRTPPPSISENGKDTVQKCGLGFSGLFGGKGRYPALPRG